MISNQIRRTVLSELTGKGELRFSDLMRACQLDPNSDTGLFLYHLHRLTRAGVIQGGEGCYQITQTGRDVAERLNLLVEGRAQKGGFVAMDVDRSIDWEAYRTPLPKIEIDAVDEEFRIRKGSVIGAVGPGRVDLMDVVDIDEKGLPVLRFPSANPVLMRKYAMPEEELYAFCLQRYTGVTKIGKEPCVESAKTFHRPDGVVLAETIQWFVRRTSGVYLKKQVSIDLHNNKPVSDQDSEVQYLSLPVTYHPSKSVAEGTYRVRVNGDQGLALKLLSETENRRWEDYPTDTGLSIGKMYIPEEETTRWELAEIYIAQKMPAA